jgi:hypothetical protein
MDSLPQTYDTIVASIQAWHNDSNPDFVAALPEIVARGEIMVQRDLDLVTQDFSVTAETVIEDPVVDKPDTLVRENTVAYVLDGRRTTLKKRSLEFVRQMQDADPGPPLYYADSEEDSWEVAPIPDLSYELLVHGIIRPETLSDRADEVEVESQKTWISRHFADLLWQAVDYHASVFLKKWRLAGDAKARYVAMLPQSRAEVATLRRHDPEDLHVNRVHQNAPTPAAPPVEN